MIRILQVDVVMNSTEFVIGLEEARSRIGSNALTGIESVNEWLIEDLTIAEF